jgi:hypothetical protein
MILKHDSIHYRNSTISMSPQHNTRVFNPNICLSYSSCLYFSYIRIKNSRCAYFLNKTKLYYMQHVIPMLY